MSLATSVLTNRGTILNNLTATTITFSTLIGNNLIGNVVSSSSTLVASTIFDSTIATSTSLYSTLIGSSITTSTLTIRLSTISLGLSTNSTNNAGAYSIAIGTQAGQSSMGTNAIAIGTLAGQITQSTNSIILNATGSIVSSGKSGFYAAPIASLPLGNSPYASILAYGTDSQIVQSNGTTVMTANGFVGIGTTNPTAAMHIVGGSYSASVSKTFDIPHPLYPSTLTRLVHCSVEGPRCDLIYRGIVQLVNGTADININKECTYDPNDAMDDGTFESLCANPQIFLQNLSGFNDLKGSISGSILTITCKNELLMDKVGWLVIAERKDPFIKQWDRTDENGFLNTQYST